MLCSLGTVINKTVHFTQFPIPHPTIHKHLTSTPLPTLMSHVRGHPAAASSSSSSSSFQQIIDSALKAYEKRTKKNLLTHPLAAQLQTCDSPDAILRVLQQQVQAVDQSQSSDERLTKWLDPTVNILGVLSAALGEGIGLVCFKTCF